MRLAVFTNQFPTRVSTFFARDIRGLINSGIEVDIFPIYPVDPSLWQHVPEILNEKILPRNRVHHLTLPQAVRAAKFWPLGRLNLFLRDTLSINGSALRAGVEPFIKTNYVFLKAWTWAQEYGTQYDHVLAYWGNYTATCAYLFRRLLPSPIPFSIFLHAGIDLYLNRVFLREKLLAADHIITCSDFNRSFINQQFSDIWDNLSEKLYVHYHGLDLMNFSFCQNGRSSRKILAVGRIDEWKGFEFLLQAIKELKVRNVDCELELVGDGKEANSLKRLAADLQIGDQVTFRGWVPSEEIPAIMSQATVLVHPSSKLGDGVPNVIKESMAVGTPVIGSAIAGIPELLKNGANGVLVPPRDVKGLADAIQRLLADPAQRQKFASAARNHAVKHFDMWRNGEALANVLCKSPVSTRVS
jgi:colanic acid/amylovoran biosynthesis glycosyltransferase